MTRVIFEKNEDTAYGKIRSEGHSGYAEEGSDIVCAAISSATELVVNILEQFSVDIDVEVDEETPSVLVIILDGEDNRKKKNVIKNIVEGYKSYISDLAEAYPEFIETSTEV
ncbi:MAG: ribosomal-processing cysteine protease Prp [Clostridia bacterium]|nr:ribosomal-processing cysteine protease Prp [Clostridia bacterium]